MKRYLNKPDGELSPALAFLFAGASGISQSTGDRLRSATMDAMMDMAIDTRMAFDVDDGQRLADSGMDIKTCVGVFCPMARSFYDRACIKGGTYARMWEKHKGVKPFIINQAWTHDREIVRNNRFAPHMAVVIPATIQDGESLEHTREGEVWWCTSVDFENDRVVLCRYKGPGTREPCRNYQRGQPAKRMVVARAEWKDFVDSLAMPSTVSVAA